ncbi:MAG: uracil-DNA glycosylase [Hydrogenophaga sp.]|uniref:uracil-DNA glycosylase n=1 Tax=Hydrogenophaga sp. TaxID=1904254 RepID=UPI001DD1353A|nr:uracil-DNA glycosylase [Hydrogenophaga sp.]MBX3611844.1 uracil-DNA glycosylase [Hydrogenophaga sp.]
MKLVAADPAQWAVAPGWRPVVDAFWRSEDGQALRQFLSARLACGATVYPNEPMRALSLTSPESVRVVILGQDPYHGAGQAEGLAFSVADGQAWPPSLRNLFVERLRDLGLPPPMSGSLVRWAEQGVLLLNTSLTVEEGAPASHAKQGWEVLTDALIAHTSQTGGRKVYLLWGAHAQKKAPLIDARHHVLVANHPSPLAARRGPMPFIGCGHFGLANTWLEREGLAAVDW